MAESETHRGKPRTDRRTHGHVVAVVAIIGLLFLVHSAHAESHLDLSQLDGKVVLLDFWASWCKPCRRSFPWMNDMQARYGDDGLVIVAVNVDNDLAAAERFLNDHPASFRVHFDEDKSLVREYEVVAMPSSFLIGRDGEVVGEHLGFRVLKQDEYEAAIRAALEEEQ